MPQKTNLNVSPYYDDFDKDDNFYKVLFKPGHPVQARELTGLQSILQNQIESFGSHMFKEGSMVIPGGITCDNAFTTIKVNPDHLGIDITVYLDAIVSGKGTKVKGVTSEVVGTIKGYILPTGNPNVPDQDVEEITLFVKYLDGANDGESVEFLNGEVIQLLENVSYGNTTLVEGDTVFSLTTVNSPATGYAVGVAQGVYFIRGTFVDVQDSQIVLDPYSNTPSYRVGFDIVEEIINSDEDPSLNDNAAGTSNYSAPGGHRFRIRTSLVKKAINDETDKNFIELLRINNSKLEQFVNNTEYSELERSLARRTYEESGDYVIDTFDIKMREHLDDGFNNGVYRAGAQSREGNAASEDMLAIEVSPGRAYVKGYRTEFLVPQYVDAPKPRDFNSEENAIVSFNLGQFVKVYDVYGWPDLTGEGVTDAYQVLEMRDDWALNPGSSVSGRQIGRCRTIQIQEDQTGIYDLYMFDIQMYTAINLAAGNQSVQVGDVIVGRTSNARGFVADAGSGNYFSLEQVSGRFVNGEVMERDGRVLRILHCTQRIDISE